MIFFTMFLEKLKIIFINKICNFKKFLLQKIVSTVKAAIDIPLTIKIRTGWDSNSRNATEACNIAYNEGISWVAIHGRTRAQGYSGLADWDFIADVKANTKIPILGNGDIHTAERAVEKLLTSKCDGVLIGRGALKNPFIFKESLQVWNQLQLSTTPQLENIDSAQLKEQLIAISDKTLTSNRDFPWVLTELNRLYSLHCSDQLREIQLKKFSAWFSAGYPGSAKFRKEIFQLKNCEQILESALIYFKDFNSHSQEDTSSEKFLMGGHG